MTDQGPIVSQSDKRTQDVVERLREEIIADSFEAGQIRSGALAERLIRERGDAADAIASLLEQVERERERADKFMWQVRDTCARAEAAESRVSVLEGVLQDIQTEADVNLENAWRPGLAAAIKRIRSHVASVISRSLPDSERRTAPETCPNCFNEEDCASVDVCRAVAEVYAPVNAGSTSSDGVSGKQRSPGQQPRPLQTEDAGQCAPGPSETLSPDVARADREAIAREIDSESFSDGFLGHVAREMQHRRQIAFGKADAILSLLSKGGGTRSEGSEG